MVKYCVAFGCKELQRKGSGIQFHGFPHSRPEILKKWIRAIRREKWIPSKTSVICSKHFPKECYKVRPNAAVPWLKDDAVPSVFNFPTHLQKESKERRQLVCSTSTISKHEESTMEIDINTCEPVEVEQKCTN